MDNRAPVSSEVLAARLRRLRVRLGLSQEQLAHRLGVSFATVNRWENGRTRISARAVALVAALESETEAETDSPDPDSPETDGRGTDLPATSEGLPVAPSSFVGRVAELAQLAAILPDTRLLCLTGPGGVGKTRLAVEAVRRLPGRPAATFVGSNRCETKLLSSPPWPPGSVCVTSPKGRPSS